MEHRGGKPRRRRRRSSFSLSCVSQRKMKFEIWYSLVSERTEVLCFLEKKKVFFLCSVKNCCMKRIFKHHWFSHFNSIREFRRAQPSSLARSLHGDFWRVWINMFENWISHSSEKNLCETLQISFSTAREHSWRLTWLWFLRFWSWFHLFLCPQVSTITISVNSLRQPQTDFLFNNFTFNSTDECACFESFSEGLKSFPPPRLLSSFTRTFRMEINKKEERVKPTSSRWRRRKSLEKEKRKKVKRAKVEGSEAISFVARLSTSHNRQQTGNVVTATEKSSQSISTEEREKCSLFSFATFSGSKCQMIFMPELVKRWNIGWLCARPCQWRVEASSNVNDDEKS